MDETQFIQPTQLNPLFLMDYSEYSSFLLLLSCFLFMFMLLKTSKQKSNLPPGPRKLPLIGNLHLFLRPDPPHRILRTLAEKHGPLMHMQLGEVGNVIVSSPEVAKHFLKTHDILFASRPSLLASEIGCYGNTDIAFAPYGEYWRQVRKICTLELFTANRVQSFRPIREKGVLDLCKSVALHAGSTINLVEKLEMTNLHIVVRTVFGRNIKGLATIISLIKEGIEFVSVFNIVDVYPSIKILRSFSSMKKKLEKQQRQMDGIMGNIIEERRRARAANGEHVDVDLLDVLLRVQDDGSLQIPLATDNIKAVLTDLFGAGIETSSTTVGWAMAEMIKNAKVLEKAQAEVRKIFDGRGYVDESLFDELKYLKLVLKETLRLHPPVPLLIPRENKKPCNINGYEIPANTRVLVNAWAIGRDPQHWENAEAFEPERFARKNFDFKASSLEYIPFGAGRRICPGGTFGMANVEMQLAMLLYHFDWSLPNGMRPEDMHMTEFGVSNKRKNGLHVIPVAMRPLPLR